MLSICKSFEFDAAHCLNQYAGKCNRVHGHRFLLEIEITGTPNTEGSDYGMILDFGELKHIVNERVIDKLDHYCLNDVLPIYPAAEYLVMWIVEQLETAFNAYDSKLIRVRLYETPNSYAEWRA